MVCCIWWVGIFELCRGGFDCGLRCFVCFGCRIRLGWIACVAPSDLRLSFWVFCFRGVGLGSVLFSRSDVFVFCE